MIDKPLVSAVIATYNMAKYLPLAIRSVLAQTYENIELLIVDDGSTDDTMKVVEPFLDDSRIKYRFQKNQGQAAAKNRGIFESTGEYIAFLDADDMWFPEKLDLQLPSFSQSETLGIVYARLLCIDEAGNEIINLKDNYTLLRGRITGPLLIHNFIRFGTTVVRRECFDRLGGFKEHIRMGIDYDLWLRFSTQYEFDYIDHPLLYYRIWPGQMSNNSMKRYLSGIEIMKCFLQEFPGLVDKKTINEAWAHTYVSFGESQRSTEQSILAALSLYARALRYKPDYLPAWKSIGKAILHIQ